MAALDPSPAGGDEKIEEQSPLKGSFTKSGRIKLGSTFYPKNSPKSLDDFKSYEGKTSWCNLEARRIEVRKKYYLSKEKVKAPSAPAMYEITHLEMVKTKKNKLTHVASYFDTSTITRKKIGGKDIKIPSHITFSVIMHNENVGMFSSSTDSASINLLCILQLTEASKKIIESGKLSESLLLWNDFIKNDFKGDKKTGNTLKMIGKIANTKEKSVQNSLSWVTRPLFNKFNGIPFLVWKAARYFWRSGMVDIEVDSHLFFPAAKKGVDTFRDSLTKKCVFDIVAIIEGRDDKHLPEQVLGCVRACYIDIEKLWEIDEATQKKIKDLPDEINEIKMDE